MSKCSSIKTRNERNVHKPTSRTIVDFKSAWETTISRALEGDIDGGIVKWFGHWCSWFAGNYKENGQFI